MVGRSRLCVGVSGEWWAGAGCVCECPVSGG